VLQAVGAATEKIMHECPVQFVFVIRALSGYLKVSKWMQKNNWSTCTCQCDERTDV